MKKKILLVFLILVFILSAAVVYINNVILPTKLKSLIIQSLEAQTHKKVSLEDLKLNIFKGLVIRDLKIFDERKTILSLQEGSCTFFFLPFFKKQIIMPTIKLKSARIFLNRRPDNTLNIMDLFNAKPGQKEKPKFDVLLYKMSIVNSRIDFQDDMFPAPFTKTLDNVNASLKFSFPDNVKFKLKADIGAASAAEARTKINGSGEYKIVKQQLSGTVSINDLKPQEFLPYYQTTGLNFKAGSIDALMNFSVKDQVVGVDLTAQNKSIALSKDELSMKLASGLKFNFKFNLSDKKFDYSGVCDISSLDITGVESIGSINSVKGIIKFDSSGATADKLSAIILGIPVQVKLTLTDYNNLSVNMDVVSSTSLSSLQEALKKAFKLALPAEIKGNANLSFNLQAKVPLSEPPLISGNIDVTDCTVKLERINSPINGINGRIGYTLNQIKWDGLVFNYEDRLYKTSGVLTDFKKPGVQLRLSGDNLSLTSVFSINAGQVKLSEFAGKYFNSDFSLNGSVDFSDSPKLLAEISGESNLYLRDLKTYFTKFKNQLDKINPDGTVNARFNISGNINDIKSCSIDAKLTSPEVSFYGLKAGDFSADISQDQGIAEITLAHLSIYGGTIDVSAKVNMQSQNMPYSLSADIKDVKIEKLKMDTPMKQKNISGVIRAQGKFNGFSNDLSRLSGNGNLFISEGRLWELNLFKGLGSVLFAKDFEHIVFHEGYCTFLVRNKFFSTDDLKLKSDIAEILGSAKIGFDSSLEASLNVNILDEMVPLTGTFRDVATAVIGRAGKFGVIKVNGTLQEPKYKFNPAVGDIIKGLKDVIFRKE